MSDKQPLIEPPPAYGAPQPQAYPQSNTTNNVIVTQPVASSHTTYETYRTSDHYFTLSIILTICCFLCGTWCALFCTIPAIVFAVNARDAEARGDHNAATANRRVALYLNIGGIITYVVTMVIIIISVSASVASRSKHCHYYHRNGYYRHYCTY